MRYIKYLLLCSVLLALGLTNAEAEEAKPEVHIYADGQIHLVYADLFRKHALNQYTVKIWDLTWSVPIDLMDTKIKFESAYGAPINPSEVGEGHKLEIKGRIVYNQSILENQIDPVLIRDLNIKTGEPLAPPTATPTPTPTPTAKPQVAGAVYPSGFTKFLKYRYENADVTRLQNFLKSNGYFPKSYKSSGYFGLATEKALMNFQKANTIEATGTLGPKTRAAINSLLQ